MMNDKNKFKPVNGVSGAAVDEKLGNILSTELEKTGGTGACLSEEDIADLVDGTAPVEEIDRMMKHLSSCDSCYDVYLLTAGLIAEEEMKTQRTRAIWFKPMALAASILIVVVSIYIFYRTDEIPKTVEQFARMEEQAKPAPSEPGKSALKDKETKTPNLAQRPQPPLKKEKAGKKQAPPIEQQPVEQDQFKDLRVPGGAATVPGTQKPADQKMEQSLTRAAAEREEAPKTETAGGAVGAGEALNNKLLSYKSYVPADELEKLFKEALGLTLSPSMNCFLSKSAPDSIEYRFFSLALSGWSDAAGVYHRGKEKGAAGPGESRLKQWEVLYPELKGIYREIAGYTITYLKKNPHDL